jgi:hypothetical protein
MTEWANYDIDGKRVPSDSKHAVFRGFRVFPVQDLAQQRTGGYPSEGASGRLSVRPRAALCAGGMLREPSLHLRE